MSLRTGYEKVLPHLVTDTFASIAEANGVVTSVDDKNKVIVVKYDDVPVVTMRTEACPYTTLQLDTFHRKSELFRYLVPASKLSEYPPDTPIQFTRNTYGKVVDRLRITSLDQIPNIPIIREQSRLLKQFQDGQEDALYLITIEPLDTTQAGPIKAYDYSDVYTSNSGSYIHQVRVANVVEGERVKEGDVLTYNKGFFTPEYGQKQVTFKHGVLATVVLMEKSTNFEDACEVSPDFAKKLETDPTHIQTLTITNTTEVDDLVAIGSEINTTDPLCRLTQEDVALLSQGEKNSYSDLLASIGSDSPKADYYGTVVDVKILYSCPKEKLSPSLQTILKAYEKRVKTKQKALLIAPEHAIKNPGYVAPGAKYHGIDFSENTVVIEVMISGPLDIAPGDKLCLGNANKSVVSAVSEYNTETEDGEVVDMIFSTTSIQNRIVSSPMDGLIERNVEELTRQCVAEFFS